MSLFYRSTRSGEERVSASEAILKGLDSDVRYRAADTLPNELSRNSI